MGAKSSLRSLESFCDGAQRRVFALLLVQHLAKCGSFSDVALPGLEELQRVVSVGCRCLLDNGVVEPDFTWAVHWSTTRKFHVEAYCNVCIIISVRDFRERFSQGVDFLPSVLSWGEGGDKIEVT